MVSVTMKLWETARGMGAKIVFGEVVSGCDDVSSEVVVCDVPFVRSFGSYCSSEIVGGGICSQRACVGCMILGMNIVFVCVS